MKKLLFIAIILASTNLLGQVGIGTTSPSPKSILDLRSTSKGFLLPRLTTAQRTGINPTAENDKGMQVFDTTTNSIWFWNGTAWIEQINTTYTGSTSITLNGAAFERAALTGDVTAAANNNATTVARIQGRDVLATAPTANQVLKWNGTAWAPAADTDTDTNTNIYSDNGTLAGNRIVTQGASTLAFTSSATNGFSVDGTTFSVDAANNRIGIGTAAPSQVLDVNGTAKVLNITSGSTALGGTDFGIYHQNAGWMRYVSNASNQAWYTDGAVGNGFYGTTPSMLLSNTGNLGLGTLTPGAKLEVVGQVKITGGTPGAGKVLTSDAAGLATWATPTAGTVTNVTGTAPISVATGTTTPVISLNDLGVTTIKLADNAVTSAKILDNTIVNADLTAGTGGIYKGSGSLTGATTVTMGTNSIAFPSTATTGFNHFSVDGSTFSVNAFDNRVGIGTTSPTETLDVRGNVMLAVMPSLGGNGYLRLGRADNLGARFHDIYAANGTSDDANILSFKLHAPSTAVGAEINSQREVMTLLGGGNVGIGTAAPSAKLEVAGQVKITGGTPGAGKVLTSDATGLASWTTPTDTNTNVYTNDGTLAANRTIEQGANSLTFAGTGNVILNSGNVGIGTSSPTSSLAIQGSISQAVRAVSGNITLNNSDSIIICDATTAGISITLPTVSSCSGRIYTIKKVDSTNNPLTFNVAINSSPSETFTSLNYQKTLNIQSDGSNWWLIN